MLARRPAPKRPHRVGADRAAAPIRLTDEDADATSQPRPLAWRLPSMHVFVAGLLSSVWRPSPVGRPGSAARWLLAGRPSLAGLLHSVPLEARSRRQTTPGSPWIPMASSQARLQAAAQHVPAPPAPRSA